MREKVGPRVGVATLEDIIVKSTAHRPTREMLAGLAQARSIMQEHGLVQSLGFNNRNDSILLHAFIADRVLKTRLYDLEWAVHSPEFSLTPKQEVIDNLKREDLQASLDRLALERGNIIQSSYPNAKARTRVRNLELAANDLIARGSVSVDDGKHDPYTEIVISDELASNWVMRWREKFAAKHHKARQKFLKYKNN